MRQFLPFLGLGLALSCASITAADLRDPEALYLDAVTGVDPIVLKVTSTAALYANRNLSAHTGNLVAGDEVRLIAHHPTAFLVRSTKGRAEGWVRPDLVTPPDPNALKILQTAVEEEARYQSAIGKKEVLAGMTFDHVLAALGKPERKSFREDENGRFDLWSYVEYETQIEQQPYRDIYTQRLLYRSVRVKVPVGSLNIEFKQGRVTAVERTQESPSPGNRLPLR
jgi:hypothetical protein